MYWFELYDDAKVVVSGANGQYSYSSLYNPKFEFLLKYKNARLEFGGSVLNTGNGISLQQMLACCGMVLLHGSYKKIGFGAHLAQLMGYSQAIYVVVEGNTGDDGDVDYSQYSHIEEFNRLGFTRLEGSEFVNSRTDNILVTYTLDLSTFKYTGEL
jgi:hypothetical protein